MFKVAIFDLNGTIIEDEGIWRESFAEVYSQFGLDSKPETLPGIGLHDNWQHIRSLHPEITTEVDVLVGQTLDSYRDRISAVSKFRGGFEELIAFLQSYSVVRILATSSDQETWQKIAEHFPTLSDYFDGIVTGDMVSRRKPAPDIFIKALAVANELTDDVCQASDCVVFEDSDAGVRAAHSAGMLCVHLPNGLEMVSDEAGINLISSRFDDPRITELFIREVV